MNRFELETIMAERELANWNLKNYLAVCPECKEETENLILSETRRARVILNLRCKICQTEFIVKTTRSARGWD